MCRKRRSGIGTQWRFIHCKEELNHGRFDQVMIKPNLEKNHTFSLTHESGLTITCTHNTHICLPKAMKPCMGFKEKCFPHNVTLLETIGNSLSMKCDENIELTRYFI